MHELAMVEKIIKIIEIEAQKNNISKVSIARLRVGKMAALQKDYLMFKDIKFEIDEVPVEIECKSCGEHFIDARFDNANFAHSISHAPLLYIPTPCPNCGEEGGVVIAGNELDLVSIESPSP